MTGRRLLTAATALGAMLVTGPALAGQASDLDSSEATAFMGTWGISLETPRGGDLTQTVTIRDEGGKVAARVEGGRGGPADVSNITMRGDDLVLTFEREGRRGRAEVEMTLALDGAETVNTTMSLGGGQFSLDGTGKKQ